LAYAARQASSGTEPAPGERVAVIITGANMTRHSWATENPAPGAAETGEDVPCGDHGHVTVAGN
jgi:hypothetical protein